jgi:large subunit ribosomal protein L18e
LIILNSPERGVIDLAKTKGNVRLEKLIKDLKVASHENGVPIWKDIALRLSRSRKRTAEVNLSKLNRVAEEGELIVVPGKVLGSGTIEKSLSVTTFEVSMSARDKIEDAGGRIMDFQELLAENPKGTSVRIVE